MSPLLLRSLPQRSAVLHLTAAVGLVAAAAGAVDDAGRILLGLAVVLAATLSLAVDEPAAELLDSLTTGFTRRVGRRLLLLSIPVVPLWVGALALVDHRGAQLPRLAVTLPLLGLTALGLAVATGLRRWRRASEPAVLTGPALLGFLAAADQLPPSLVLMVGQTWGPPYEVALLRWSAVTLAALAVLLVAASDPATARTRRR